MNHLAHKVAVLNSDCSEKSSEVCVKVMTVVFIIMIHACSQIKQPSWKSTKKEAINPLARMPTS